MEINTLLDGQFASATTNQRIRLTDIQRQAIYEELLKQSENGRLKRGSTNEVANKFSVKLRTVQRIWKQAINSINASSMMVRRVGRKRVQLSPSKVCAIPLRRRTNIRSMSNALNISKSTLHRRIKEGFIRAHSNAIKPSLTIANKKQRLEFCLSMITSVSDNGNPIFNGMFNYIHIDEKWFYMTKNAEKYYLLPEEVDPLRTCKSKRYITKVMFLAAVARPRFDSLGHVEFSGKIGIFPFVFKESAKRKSKNREAGTLETKAVTSITKDVIRDCLIQKVLPAIHAKWPSNNSSDPIFIQQDNAKPHIKENDVEFMNAASMNGFDIRMCFQPPNSPDLNVLDLGYFRAIQSLQHQEAPTTIDELVHAVEKSFDSLSSESLNFTFLSLQNCMIEMMKVNGGNEYRLPHMGKHRLQREGILPIQLEVDNELVQSVHNQLEQLEE